MKAVLNVKGTKLNVTVIYYHKNGLPSTVYAVDENGREQRFIETSQSEYVTQPHIAVDNLSELLEYPELEARIVDGTNELIAHLDEMLAQENQELINIAVDAMESEADLPFDSHLSIKQKEYKLKQQRVLGLIDAVEEVKAFTEGYYANVDDQSPKA